MRKKLIPATELAEFVYCPRAWELKYLRGVEASRQAQHLQVEGNAWHAAQGRVLARSGSPALGRLCRTGACCDSLHILVAGMGAMTLSVMAATLAILAVALFLLAAQSRRRIGIPAGALVYQDLPGQPFDGKPLRSHTLGISGKPDCLIRTVTGIVPVELKNASKPPARGEVYPSHMIQALAYCALVEDQIKDSRSLCTRDLRRPAGTASRIQRAEAPVAARHDPPD